MTVLDRPSHEGVVAQLESLLQHPLPEPYRRFLLDEGGRLYGIYRPRELLGSVGPHTALETTLRAAIAAGGFPVGRLVLEDLGDDTFALLNSATGGVDRWRFAPDRQEPLVEVEQLAPDFLAYLERVEREARLFDVGIAQLQVRVKEFDQVTGGYEHGQSAGKLPKARDWRPYRFCVQDVIVASTVLRHWRETNAIEVDVFLAADVPGYEPGGSVRALTLFLLSESVKCGATGEIRFTQLVEDGEVPAAVQRLAKHHGVAVGSVRGVISPAEARELYIALSEFPGGLEEQLRVLHSTGALPLEIVPFLAQRGVWSTVELAVLVGLAPDPARMFGGGASPQQRLIYLQDLAAGRAAVLAGLLDRQLRRRDDRIVSPDHELEVEDDVRPIDVEVVAEIGALLVRSPVEDAPIRWPLDDAVAPLLSGELAIVGLRPRDVSQTAKLLSEDIDLVASWRGKHHPNARAFLLLPDDAGFLPGSARAAGNAHAAIRQVTLLRAPEPLAALDRTVTRRLAQGRLVQR